MTQCPRTFATSADFDLIDLAEFARRGSWPLPGGVLNQTRAFIQAAQMVWSAYTIHFAKRGVAQWW